MDDQEYKSEVEAFSPSSWVKKAKELDAKYVIAVAADDTDGWHVFYAKTAEEAYNVERCALRASPIVNVYEIQTTFSKVILHP